MSDSLLPIPSELVGSRFDIALSKMISVSRANAISLIDSGQAKIADKKSHKSSILQNGDLIILSKKEDIVSKPVLCNMQIVYNDDDIVVVDKPVGVAAHAAAGWEGATVVENLLAMGININVTKCESYRRGIVSRLDVGTSGLMLVCKSDLTYEVMKQQFKNHDVIKIYHALVQGNIKQDKATIDAPIGRAKVCDFRFTVTESGKPAITHWDVIERFRGATLVKVNLETGRTHQIRVHFSSIGHPVVGDPMYGANPQLSKTLGLSRQWLHAMTLKFKHPRTNKLIVLESKYPSDLQHALQAVRQL